ncbi:sporulation integral membrane protein YlbJ [Ruminiclostridium sufflavum DSM 19573]|uniref:Sporulation integral membrane protein YlbJ n=1 Tax=Ruminiclostridium sufflavum DSM 19573 TaxID=1121337 RepID=A0A318XK59_9FIRM|nr:sporulation integral membrane protein YlbJ [Ruminiclostridium sufflavum]PYG86848.1 sporulation integral membrane protein YlbJ [Ruminiclostridium sufflavum DSM 19573]
MNIFILLSFTALTVSAYFIGIKAIYIYMKKSILPIFGILLIAALVIYPKTVVAAASQGINLWLNIVFPSLFPFFVASQLLSKSGFINIFGIILEPIMRPLFNIPGCGSFALAMGIISGYPVGATITADLKRQELISKIEAERLLTFTNNSGPLFIMGSVAVGMLQSPKIGYLLYISHVAACLTVGMLFKFYRNKSSPKTKLQKKTSQKLHLELQRMRNTNINTWTLFGECIKNSIFTILTIGGFIIFFSVLINILITSGVIGRACSLFPDITGTLGIDSKTLEGVLCGLFEITTGSNLISLASSDFKIKLCCISLIIGWAGFSVHTQVLSIVSSSDISVKPYIIGKAIQGILSAAYTYIGATFFGKALLNEAAVFSDVSAGHSNSWSNICMLSVQNIIILSAVIISVSLLYICYISITTKKRLL